MISLPALCVFPFPSPILTGSTSLPQEKLVVNFQALVLNKSFGENYGLRRAEFPQTVGFVLPEAARMSPCFLATPLLCMPQGFCVFAKESLFSRQWQRSESKRTMQIGTCPSGVIMGRASRCSRAS